MIETSANYQHMTLLPEPLERALLDVPMTALLKHCTGWTGASDKYLCIQRLARELEEKELWAIARADHSGEQNESGLATTDEPVAPARKFKAGNFRSPDDVIAGGSFDERNPIKAKSISTAAATDSTAVRLAAGKTNIQPGSLRAQLLDLLRAAPENSMTLGALSQALGREAKPIVAKLRAAGWVS